MKQPILVPPGEKIKLADYDPGDTGDYHKKSAAKADLKDNVKRLQALQEVMWAGGNHGLLIVLQALDAGGKDGTIKHVMRGVNPQGCQVTSFKVPTEEEQHHDYLWRIHRAVPRRGYIGIFNRSHYEDVLVVRVHNLVPREVWQERYDEINNFEKLLADSGITVLKFYLHISRDEQKKRFEERLQDPKKNWKFSTSDIKEREYWDEYMRAYEDALGKCSTAWAPWHIVPADHKWYRNLVVSQSIIAALDKLDMHFPPPLPDAASITISD